MHNCNNFWLQVKGLSTEEYAARNDLVLALPDRIQAIPDGTPAGPKKTGGWTASASRAEIKFDSGYLSTSFLDFLLDVILSLVYLCD